jgi:pimeloyl-ACP methyl ester carboxylesterase
MGTETPHPFIKRHFATIDGKRQIHYRRAGKGPSVLLLHQSPTSSREYIPLIEALSPHFTVFAPDTPGNGLSDPLTEPEAPSMDDYGDNIAKFLDAIGLAKVAVYGFHTGASVAAAFSTRHPHRVHGTILNGFVALTPEERADILANYLVPIVPRWDGGHLVLLWARVREQSIFFPWYRAALAGRADRDLPPLDVIHWNIMEWLRAGDAYRKPYGAAFRYPGDEVAMRFTAPTVICASDWDTLVRHLDRLPKNLPACVEVKRIGPDRAAVAPFVLAELKRFANGEAPAPVRPKPLAARAYQDFVDVPGGQLHMRRVDGSGRLLLVQHDAASDNRIVDRATSALLGRRTALAFDLPGNGESDNTIGTSNVTVPLYAEVVAQALDALGLKEVDAYGMWGGGSVMLDLALQRPATIKHLVMSNVLFFDAAFAKELHDKYTFLIEPDWYGGYLLKCWHAMRDQGLYWPWYERTRKGIIWQEPFLDTNMVHNRVVAMLKAGHMYHHHYRAHFAYPTGESLKRLKVPVALGSPRWDPNYGDSQRAHAATKGSTWIELPPDMKDWPAAFLPFLDG